MSDGRLHVDGQVLPRRYRSREGAKAYLAEIPGSLGQFGRFNLEILTAVDTEVDLGLFDNDGPDGVPNSGDDDGYVDIVFINLHTSPRDFFVGVATGIASLGLKRRLHQRRSGGWRRLCAGAEPLHGFRRDHAAGPHLQRHGLADVPRVRARVGADRSLRSDGIDRGRIGPGGRFSGHW